MPMLQPLRRVSVPLRKGEADAILNVQSLIEQAYEKGAYGKTIDYAKPCDPSLSADDAAWAEQMVKSTS